jgi:glycosyltransferase involved in cell wall biosynthesis
MNAERHLTATAESVLRQDYPPCEYIVKDGGSTDGTTALIAALPPGVIVMSGPDRGQTDAINAGLRRARGEIVSWINASDLYSPGAFRIVASYFSEHPDVGMVFGRARLIGEQGEDLGTYACAPLREMLALNHVPRGHFMKLLHERSGWIPQQTVFWRRSVMASSGYLDPDLHYAMDYDYWLRLGRCTTIHFVDADLGAFRLHPDAKSRAAGRQWREVLLINRRHGGALFSPIHRAFLSAAGRAMLRRAGLAGRG